MNKDTTNTAVDWEPEFQRTAFKFHILAAWIAVVFNPLWVIGDYYNARAHFLDFFVFRIVVSFLTLITLFLKNKLKHFPELIGLVPVVGITLQNAYMYSVMDVAQMQIHTFAFLAIFIGAGMFMLWKIRYSVLVIALCFVASVFFFKLNSPLPLDVILTNGGLLTITVALFSILLIQTRTNLTKREIISRLSLAESNKELEIKNKIIREKNKDIHDSIVYAKRIQQALLPSLDKIKKDLEDFFILYKPKDVIGGDFYWYANVTTTPLDGDGENVFVIAAVDCTGHGVPGALMSIIGSTILNQTVALPTVNSPADVLNYLNQQVNKTLNTIKDGMDMSLCAINLNKMELQYAGANNPLFVLRNKKLIEIKADKLSIGADLEYSEGKLFTNNKFTLEKDDCIYLFTDGYADQFGGPQGKKFKYKQFYDVLASICDEGMAQQQELLEYHYQNWRGSLEQVDDILIVGIRVP